MRYVESAIATADSSRRRRLPPRITDAEIDTIRLAAREAVEAASLRKVAPEIGIGHSTLANFLSGARPHPRVRRILHDWNVNRKGPPPVEAAELDRLIRELPDLVGQRVRARLARVLAGGYVESEMEMPGWLRGPWQAQSCAP